MEANGGNVCMDAFNKGKALAPQSMMGSGGMNSRPSGMPPHGLLLNDEGRGAGQRCALGLRTLARLRHTNNLVLPVVFGHKLTRIHTPHRSHATFMQHLAGFFDHGRVSAQHDARLLRSQRHAGRLFKRA